MLCAAEQRQGEAERGKAQQGQSVAAAVTSQVCSGCGLHGLGKDRRREGSDMRWNGKDPRREAPALHSPAKAMV